MPLHGGRVPRWLYARMVRLAGLVLRVMHEEHGPEGIVERLSSPLWFQALNNLIGMDWDSSGSTTVTTAVLREALERSDLELRVVGGKGRAALSVPQQLRELGRRWDIDVGALAEASRLVAKVDSALVQDGYDVYHHALFVTSRGTWAVVQQGMDPARRMARRYHWYMASDYFNDPHRAIVGVRGRGALNMASSASAGARKTIMDVVRDGSLGRDLMALAGQSTLLDVPRYHPWTHRPRISVEEARRIAALVPRDAADFRDLVLARGVGPRTIRALALVAELVYGSPADWRDPANVDPFKYAFAVGGKDGVPYPVDRRAYDELIGVLGRLIDVAVRAGDRGVLGHLRRLALLARGWSPDDRYRRPTY